MQKVAPWRVHELKHVLYAYWAAAIVSALFWPSDLGLAPALGIAPEQVPMYGWASGVPGVLPQWRDHFLAMWLVTPVWLVVFGLVYVRYYSSRGVNLPIAMLAIPILLGFVMFGLWAHPDVPAPESRHGLDYWGRRTGRKFWFLWHAARGRVYGAIAFGLMNGVLFAFLALALVKFPIDIARGGRR